MAKFTSMVQAVRYLADSHPNAIYVQPDLDLELPSMMFKPRCFYFEGKVSGGPDGSCGCILGQAIQLCDDPMKSTVSEMMKRNDLGGDISAGFEALSVLKILEGFATPEEIEWLYHVQFRQDNGDRWGRAVASADKYRPLT